MKSIRNILENETNGTCYGSYKYCADEELKVPTINYEDNNNFTLLKNRYGETDTSLKHTKNIEYKAKQLAKSEPLFRYFLDGSRRTYKVDDIEINRRIFPIMAGQVGVACCERKSYGSFKCSELDNSIVISLPTEANPDTKNEKLFFNKLREKINNVERVKKTGVRFSSVLSYSSKINVDSEELKYEHLGIAKIQDTMVDIEKKIVSSLTAKNLLNEDRYLMKDGSLQYKPMKTGDYKELSKIKNNYRWVIGVSKLFNPEFIKDRGGKSNAASLAQLPTYHRTPAFMFQHEQDEWSYLGDYKYSIWYVRIRKSENPFAGIVKVEKILITDEENENGLESDLVDVITANIINERNPVCF